MPLPGFALTGDAAATDPVCHLSPEHARVADLAAVQDEAPYLFGGSPR